MDQKALIGVFIMSNTIKTTMNYGMFEPHEMNRDVDEKSLEFKRLVDSMRKHGFLSEYPIGVISNGGGRLKIRSGHNRYVAAQKAGVPVKYVISNIDVELADLEVGPGKWKSSEFFKNYCDRGYPDYLEIKNFMDKTGIDMGSALSMFIGQQPGSGNYNNQRKHDRGLYKITDREYPWVVGNLVIELSQRGVPWAKNRLFVVAIGKLIRVPEFSVDHLLSKIETFPYLMEKQRTADEYLKNIEFTYNYKVPKNQKINLAFLAQREADKRKNKLLAETKRKKSKE